MANFVHPEDQGAEGLVATIKPPSSNASLPAIQGAGRETGEDYGAARCRREIAEADKAEFELAQLQGSLIDAAGIEMALETAFLQIRDTMMGVPDRLPTDAAHRKLFPDSLRDTLTDAVKTLPMMRSGEPLHDGVAHLN